MLIYPAIDLMGGNAVRLVKGEKETAEIVGKPLELIERFKPAPLVHVVDLDGAFAGHPAQVELIEKLAAQHRIQVGGGIRSFAHIEDLMELGVERVVLGTIATQQPEVLVAAVNRWGADRVVVAVDVKDGKVAVSGWRDTHPISPREHCQSLAEQGVRWILCTAVHRDGTMEGPDLNVLNDIQAADPRLLVIASGGIGSLDDVRSCRHLGAVIIGKALYANRFTLEEAIQC